MIITGILRLTRELSLVRAPFLIALYLENYKKKKISRANFCSYYTLRVIIILHSDNNAGDVIYRPQNVTDFQPKS